MIFSIGMGSALPVPMLLGLPKFMPLEGCLYLLSKLEHCVREHDAPLIGYRQCQSKPKLTASGLDHRQC